MQTACYALISPFIWARLSKALQIPQSLNGTLRAKQSLWVKTTNASSTRGLCRRLKAVRFSIPIYHLHYYSNFIKKCLLPIIWWLNEDKWHAPIGLQFFGSTFFRIWSLYHMQNMSVPKHKHSFNVLTEWIKTKEILNNIKVLDMSPVRSDLILAEALCIKSDSHARNNERK